MKTLQEILQEVKTSEENKKYFRTIDYIRAVALTNALTTLSKKDGFNLLGANVCTLYDRGTGSEEEKELSKTPSVGLYARFSLGNDYVYYIQIDENIFMDCYIITTRQSSKDKNTILSQYIDENGINHILYDNITFDNTPENIKQIEENILRAIREHKTNNTNYSKTMPRDYMEQKIYKI